MEGSGHFSSTFHQELDHAAAAQVEEEGIERPLVNQIRTGPGAGGGITQDDPQRVPRPRKPCREGRIVGPDRSGADQDGVALRPQLLDVGSGFRPGYPLAGPVGRGNPPVQGGGQLEDHPWSAGPPVGEIGRQGLRHVGGADPHVHLYARLTQPVEAGTGHVRIRVDQADDHPADAGGDQGIGARWCPAVVRAGLEGDVDRRSPGRGTGQVEGHHLGVRAARWLGSSQSDGLVPIGNHDRPDPRVR